MTIGNSIIALQSLKSGKLLMTVKREVYFTGSLSNYESRVKLNNAVTIGDPALLPKCTLAKDRDNILNMLEACKVENIISTFECNIKYDEFFSVIKDVLTKAGMFEDVKSNVSNIDPVDLWALFLASKDDDVTLGFINTQFNLLLTRAIPEDKVSCFESVCVDL